MNMNTWANSLLSLACVLGLSLIGSLLSRRLNKSALIFYILFGVFFANFVFRGETSRQIFEPLANLGIVFLLFTIGLELSLERLKRAGKLILRSALLQIVLSGIFFSLLCLLLGQGPVLSLFIGFGLSMSSTAIVGKFLQQKAEDASLTGEITLSTLVLQDIVSVVLVTFMTFFVGQAQTSLALAGLFLQKALIVLVSFVFLSKIIDFSFRRFRFNHEELSLLVFAVIFLLMGTFLRFGIPDTTAGFLIGLILAHRVEQTEIFSQVRVFRDVLLVLFFFFLGTYLHDLSLALIVGALFLAVLIMLFKFLLAFIINLVLGMHQKTAFWMAFDLMQVGEFAFIIATMLNKGHFLTGPAYQLFLLVITWSLIIFSMIYHKKQRVYGWFSQHLLNRFRFIKRLASQNKLYQYNQLDFSDHIILCGYGRVGAYLGHGLILSHLPLVVIDTNAEHIQKLLKKGVRAIYGDATEIEILDYAQVEKARFLIVSIPNTEEQERIILLARKMNPKIQILTRTHLSSQLRHFKSLGVELIFQPEFEAALSMLKRIMKIFNIEKTEIKKTIQYLKMEHGTEN